MEKPLAIRVEQIAFTTNQPEELMSNLTAILGLPKEWARDTVVTKGSVKGVDIGEETTADLAFNYGMAGIELEVLRYRTGPNWLEHRNKGRGVPALSHIGMHVTLDEMAIWKERMESESIPIIQEVYTQSHTNPFLLENGRRYHYVIFDTQRLLGFDLKLIRRIDKES